MKHIPLSTLVLFLCSCASSIPFTKHEHCALDGMVLDGFDSSNVVGSKMTTFDGGYAVTNSSSSSETVHCSPPKNDADRCVVGMLNAGLKPKVDYNSNIDSKRLYNGVGYVLYVVPGFVMYELYDSQKTKAIKEAQDARDQYKCDRSPASTH